MLSFMGITCEEHGDSMLLSCVPYGQHSTSYYSTSSALWEKAIVFGQACTHFSSAAFSKLTDSSLGFSPQSTAPTTITNYIKTYYYFNSKEG